MAQHGKGTAVLVNQYDLSAYLNSADWSRTCDAAETTTFGADSKTYIPGLKDGSMSASGLFDATAGAAEPVLAAALGSAATLVTFCLAGAGTIGNRVKLATSIQTAHDVSSPVADVVSTAAEFQPNGGVWGGHIAKALGATTATGDSTSVDGGASSTGGWVATIHCTGVSGTNPTLASKMQDSANDSTWADLSGAAFAQLAAAGSEQLTGTGAVARYTREAHTIGGTDTPTFTYAVAFARK